MVTSFFFISATVFIISVAGDCQSSGGQSEFILPKSYGSYSACCQSQIYDYRYNTCCNGVVTPGCGYSTSCCDQVAYNSDTYVCCHPSMLIKYKAYGIYTGCCGTTVYDTRNQSCCGWTVYDYRYQSCCGSTVYDVQHQTCCYDTVIDRQTQVCCGNGSIRTVDSNAQNYGCCGAGTFNFLNQTCCGGAVRPYVRYMSCCGNVTYNITSHSCCYLYGTQPPDGGLYQIIAETVYEITSEICCNGVIRPSVYGSQSLCCGAEVYNSSQWDYRSYCCGSSLVAGYTSCCYDVRGLQATPYNYDTQICCNGAVQGRLFGYSSSCCGSAVYNSSSSICCGENLFPYTSYSTVDNYFSYPTLSCCGGRPYNYVTQLCCYGCN